MVRLFILLILLELINLCYLSLQCNLLIKCMISHTICHFIHDEVIKWKHFPHDWPSLWGLHRSPVNSSHQGQRRRALIFSLLSIWTNGWVNNWYAGDLRCHCAHYDASVQDTDQTMGPQKTLHISLSQASYGVSFVKIMIYKDSRLCLWTDIVQWYLAKIKHYYNVMKRFS